MDFDEEIQRVRDTLTIHPLDAMGHRVMASLLLDRQRDRGSAARLVLATFFRWISRCFSANGGRFDPDEWSDERYTRIRSDPETVAGGTGLFNNGV